MCGIAGFCNLYENYTVKSGEFSAILNNMNHAQRRRGPDDEGIILTKECGLAHVRLSIIDLKNGRQPITKRLNGKTATIVFNGEIYNMASLRRELELEGIDFQTSVDTEVILKGYLRYGINYLDKLNGIFSFAIWDETEKTLYLARDRLGVKPLFYKMVGDTIVFASEIKGVFAYPGVVPEVDREGLCEIFALGPARSYGKGVFCGIKEVLPGHFIRYSKEGIKDYEYWSLKSRPHTDTLKETIDKTAYLLKDAIELQTLSDVPICSFLSGGVDSSLVTAICAEKLRARGESIKTYSFDFQGNDEYFKASSFQPSQDRPYVDQMVDYCKTDHEYLECTNQDLIDCLFKTVDARDLPCMADVESSLLYFCSKVADKNKVVLTGECADEIFGGYPWFHKKEMFERDAFPWSYDMEPRKKLLKDSIISELPFEEYSKKAYQTSIAETPVLAGEAPKEKRRRELAYLNIRWFMANLLDRMDRTSMYSGLEARVPFADHRIVEYIWNVPWEMKACGGIVKGLLRKAGERYLPISILYRKKSPYPKTYHPGYEKQLGDMLLTVLSNRNSPISSFVDKNKVEKFLKTPSDYGKPWYGQLMAGPQMLAYLLQINYWFEKYKTKIIF